MRNTFQKKMKRTLVGLLAFCLILGFCRFENNAITVSDYVIESEKLPESFDGFVIVHLSDLHNKSFGNHQERLIRQIKNQKPDMIVITGDLIDSNRPDVEPGLVLVEEALKIAPVYFVTGNHDNWLSDTDTYYLFHGLEQLGAVVLKDESVKISCGKEENFTLLGVDDETISSESKLNEVLSALTEEEDAPFTVLLAHEPQEIAVYAAFDMDLVLSGHAHGGQFRIPFIGGFVAPDQGFLPEYTKGMYVRNTTRMIVNAGLGNSVVPQRLLNRPELVKITLKCK